MNMLGQKEEAVQQVMWKPSFLFPDIQQQDYIYNSDSEEKAEKHKQGMLSLFVLLVL